MFRKIIYGFLLASLSGCVIPISSSCIDTQKHEHPDVYHPPKTSKCSTADAVVYVLAATLKTLKNEDKGKEPKVETKKTVKCSDMIGKAQKECVRKEKALNDPLDEL